MKTRSILALAGLFLAVAMQAQPKLTENNVPEVVKAMTPMEKA